MAYLGFRIEMFKNLDGFCLGENLGKKNYLRSEGGRFALGEGLRVAVEKDCTSKTSLRAKPGCGCPAHAPVRIIAELGDRHAYGG